MTTWISRKNYEPGWSGKSDQCHPEPGVGSTIVGATQPGEVKGYSSPTRKDYFEITLVFP